jgi:hypothetical protein
VKPLRRIDGFERQKEVRSDAMVGGIAAIHFDDRGSTEGRFGSDAPPFISNPYRIAWAQTDLTHGACPARVVPQAKRRKSRAAGDERCGNLNPGANRMW